MAVKRLREYGLKSERLLWPTKGPSVFEQELSTEELESKLGLTTLDAFLELCATLKIGIIQVPVLTESRIHVDVYECITCAGLATVGRTLCHFEGGLIAGVVEGVVRKRAKAKEVTCIGGLGHDSCGFEIDVGT